MNPISCFFLALRACGEKEGPSRRDGRATCGSTPTSPYPLRPQGRRGKSNLLGRAPDVARGLDHELEFLALVADRQRIAANRRGKATLRRQCQSIERHDLRRFLDAPLELVLALELRLLGGDEAEHR